MIEQTTMIGNFVLFGPPGSGKGTQATRLAQSLQLEHLSTGDLFRQAVQNKTPLGLKAKEYMNAGKLVPDDVIIPMVEERLLQLDSSQGFLLDGFPRTIPQAEQLDQFLKKQNRSINKVLWIDATDEICIERLCNRSSCSQCGAIYNAMTQPPKQENICDQCQSPLRVRDDDKSKTVAHRLKVYRQESAPLVEYYKSSHRLFWVDGSKNPEIVFKSLENML